MMSLEVGTCAYQTASENFELQNRKLNRKPIVPEPQVKLLFHNIIRIAGEIWKPQNVNCNFGNTAVPRSD